MGDPTVRQRKVARTLRAWRESRGLRLDDVIDRVGWSRSKLSRLETANTIAGPAEVIVLATIYKIPDEVRDEYAALARSDRTDHWWRKYPEDVVAGNLQDYLELEAEASKVHNFEIFVVPGLLQTADYATAVVRGWEPPLPEDVIESKAGLRVKRQARLCGENPLRFHAVICEASLRCPVGGTATMRAQLDHIIQMSTLPNIDVQILATDVGQHPAMGLAFCLVQLGEHSSPVLYMDTLAGGLFVEEDNDVARCSLAFERLSELALDLAESADLITKIRRSLR